MNRAFMLWSIECLITKFRKHFSLDEIKEAFEDRFETVEVEQ